MNKAIQPKKKKVASLDAKKSRAGWLFVLPFVIGFVLLYIPMLFQSVQFSFSEINILTNQGGGGGGYELEFVGWENYSKALFNDANFVKSADIELEAVGVGCTGNRYILIVYGNSLESKNGGKSGIQSDILYPGYPYNRSYRPD